MNYHRETAERLLNDEVFTEQAHALRAIAHALLDLTASHEKTTQTHDLMRQLEGITPGGSEFHDSPDNCLRWISERLAGRAHQVKLRRNAEAKAEAYANAMRRILFLITKWDGHREQVLAIAENALKLEAE